MDEFRRSHLEKVAFFAVNLLTFCTAHYWLKHIVNGKAALWMAAFYLFMPYFMESEFNGEYIYT